ncbi:MAG: hypothetical protein ACJA1Z_000195 [Patiriisocius sp.]|jgi:hypothetical protein
MRLFITNETQEIRPLFFEYTKRNIFCKNQYQTNTQTILISGLTTIVNNKRKQYQKLSPNENP